MVRQDINRAFICFCFHSYTDTGLRSCSWTRSICLPRSSLVHPSRIISPITREGPTTTPLVTTSSIGSSASTKARQPSKYMRIILVRRIHSKLSVCSRSLLLLVADLTSLFFTQSYWAPFKTSYSSCIWESVGCYKLARSYVLVLLSFRSGCLARLLRCFWCWMLFLGIIPWHIYM